MDHFPSPDDKKVDKLSLEALSRQEWIIILVSQFSSLHSVYSCPSRICKPNSFTQSCQYPNGRHRTVFAKLEIGILKSDLREVKDRFPPPYERDFWEKCRCSVGTLTPEFLCLNLENWCLSNKTCDLPFSWSRKRVERGNI